MRNTADVTGGKSIAVFFFAVRQVVKIIAESLSQHDEKHVVPYRPHLVWEKGRKKKIR
jgi:hypothetical protein